MPTPIARKKTATATEAEIFAGTAVLANRRGMSIQNNGANVLYLSFVSGELTTSTDNGFVLNPYEEMGFDFSSPDKPQKVYGRCGTGLTTELRIVEW